jgi:hypothetical protein
MNESTIVGRFGNERSETGNPGTNGELSWSSRMNELADSPELLRSDAVDGGIAAATDAEDNLLDAGVEQLREDARRAAREDAALELPTVNATVITEQEALLRERCRGLFERWTTAERRRIRDVLVDREEQVTRLLGRTEILLDRFERMISQVIRLKAKRSTRQQALAAQPAKERERSRSGISTRIYLLAISFLGVVEFFANAPVFSTLLPRDPLTERQIDVIAETSDGWLAGAQRVLAQLVLRPDAALLAAGVVTFLLVLAHFFGHSLRELVMRRGPETDRGATPPRTITENAVPMLLTGVGLVLVLGVLFQARVILGDVGERRYDQDMAVVSELRRESGWLRTDGELLQASQLTDQADDMEAASARLREYAASMSRMTLPILLLNITLVLAAITAAYFHLRVGVVDDREEEGFENSREGISRNAEATASEISDMLSRAGRPLRELAGLATDGYSRDPGGVARSLESVIAAYRAENAAARGLTTTSVAAFRGDVALGLSADPEQLGFEPFRRAAADARDEHGELRSRFRDARDRLNRQLNSWAPETSGDTPDPESRAKAAAGALLCVLLAGLGAACGQGMATAEDREPPRQLAIFVYDRSGSVADYQLELARELTTARLRQLGHGDHIVAMELLEASLDEPPQRWSQAVPAREYADLEVASDELTRTRFLRDAASYMKRFTETDSRTPTRGTDILSTLHDVAADIRAHPEHRPTLYMFSDMLQANPTLNFEGEGRHPPTGWVESAAAGNQLPDLENLCVVVVGARTETDRGQAVKDFWLRYFEVTGAVLHSGNYTLRPVALPELPCGPYQGT